MNELPVIAPDAPLGHKDFILWLQSKEPGEVIGEAGNFCACPFATYLKERRGWRSVSVVPHRVSGYFCERGISRRTHTWIREFIRAIDRKYKTFPVTAAEALATLGVKDGE